MEEEFITELEEARKAMREKIPEMISRAKGIIPEYREAEWERLLNSAAQNPFLGADPEDLLGIMEMLSNGATFEKVRAEIESMIESKPRYMKEPGRYRDVILNDIAEMHEQGPDLFEAIADLEIVEMRSGRILELRTDIERHRLEADLVKAAGDKDAMTAVLADLVKEENDLEGRNPGEPEKAPEAEATQEDKGPEME